MKKYIVKTRCFGFKGRLWEEGTIVDLDDDAEPPRHFELLGKEVKEKEPEKAEEPKALSELQTQQVKKQITASEALKDDKGEKKRGRPKKEQ